MTITTKENVRAAVERAMQLHPDMQSAIHAVAVALHLSEDTVRQVVMEGDEVTV